MKKKLWFGAFVIIFVLFLGFISDKDVSAASKASIPEDALLYNGHYYYHYAETVTWDEAEAKCEEIGGHLVTFSNKEEEDAVWNYIEYKGTPAWIGLYNTGGIDRVYYKVDYDWKAVNGEKIKYTNWALGQPDGTYYFFTDTFDAYAVIGRYDEVGGFIDSPTPSWGDFDSVACLDNVKGYICEWDVYVIETEFPIMELTAGGSDKIGYTVYDAAGMEKVKGKVSFKSSSKKIAKVNSSGTITAVKPGTCKISLTYKNSVTKIQIRVLPKKTTGLKASKKTNNSITLKWDTQDGSAGYQIYMYDKKKKKFVLYKNVENNKGTAIVLGLDGKTEYTFKVRAYIKKGKKKYTGEFSKELSVSTK
ncbi:MAG: fibronectin type III domain-containing protein [Lachnospiraceae bacterium]|nr:fibronectin type III domain-containing protein [Lachnospiraceae bacterium]